MQGQIERFGKGIDNVLTDEQLNRILTLVHITVGVAELFRIVVALGQALGIC